MNIGIPKDFRRYLSMRGVSVINDESQDHQPLTGRALAIGSFLSFFLAVGANYADIVIKGSYMTLDFSTPGAIFVFLVVVGGLNSLFKLTARWLWLSIAVPVGMAIIWLVHFAPYDAVVLHSPGVLFGSFLVVAFTANAVLAVSGRNMALNRSELIVVYIMLVVVASLATMGLCETILPAISGFFYYASPENKWAELLIPHLPPEIVVNDGINNRDFFEGMGKTYQIPWLVWLRPMAMWMIFLIALYTTMVSIVVILRRQWVDRERLSYPLVQAAQVMIRGEESGKFLNPFFRSKVMWAGASLPMIVGLFTGLNKYLGGFPLIPTAWAFPIGFGQSINMTISFAVVGFSYLIGPDIAMGIWGFALLSKVEKMLLVANGVTKHQDVWSVRVSELINYQGIGALVVFVALGLWVGREHLTDVWRSFLGRRSNLNDDDEIMSYRAAVTGMLLGSVTMIGWFVYLGTPLWSSILYIFLLMTIFTGLSRVVAESGVAAIITPMNASDFMLFGLGGKLIGAQAATNFSLGYIFGADIRVFLMGVVANGLKLIEGMNKHSRRIVTQAIAIAILLGLAGSMYTILALSYRDGGINSSPWFFKSMPGVIARTALHGLDADPTYWTGLGFTGIGAVAMLVLTWVRQRFLWWPLHPIGFPIMTSWVVDWMWFSIFFAWVIKVIILKYGGAAVFTRSRDFFLGLIVGRMFISGGWLVVDYLTGTVSNPIFWI